MTTQLFQEWACSLQHLHQPTWEMSPQIRLDQDVLIQVSQTSVFGFLYSGVQSHCCFRLILMIGLPCDVLTLTCGGNNLLCTASGPGKNMFESTDIIGHK
jgi:hypothetical protein